MACVTCMARMAHTVAHWLADLADPWPTWFSHVVDSFVIKRFSSKHCACLSKPVAFPRKTYHKHWRISRTHR